MCDRCFDVIYVFVQYFGGSNYCFKIGGRCFIYSLRLFKEVF